MNVALTKIIPGDAASIDGLPAGHQLRDEVVLEVDGMARTFTIQITVRPSGIPTSIMRADRELNELLRSNAGGLGELYNAVAAHRRGEHVELPLPLVDEPVRRVAV